MKLPSTWLSDSLANFCQINPRHALPIFGRPDEDLEVSFIPMSAVDETVGAITKPVVRRYGDVSKGYTGFLDDDVLFAKVTPCMENGKVAIANNLIDGFGFGSTEFHVLRTNTELLPEYLYYFIRQKNFRDYAASAFIGTGGLQRVPQDFLARVKLPLPTLPEQDRIVAVLRQAEALGELRRQSADLLARAKRELFFNTFGHPDPHINQTWPVVRLGTLLDVATGGTPPRGQSDSFGGNVAWVKSTDLTDKPILRTDENVTELGIQRSNATVYPVNTILLAMYGQGQTRGRTGKLLVEAACNQACAALLPSKKILPDYLWVWLQLSYEAVRALGRGGQQENLNLSIVRNIKIPVPPIAHQIDFSRQLQQLLDITQASTDAAKQIKTLFEALQIEVFSGEATAKWRETNKIVVKKAAKARDARLGKGLRVARATDVAAVPPPNVMLTHAGRATFELELSDFQRHVFHAFAAYPVLPLFAEDEDKLAAFVTHLRAYVESEGMSFSKNHVQRVLGQLAAFGLIGQMSVLHGEQFLKAFRLLRSDERVRLTDLDQLNRELTQQESAR
jgi:type I restriction enzyme, S subunit